MDGEPTSEGFIEALRNRGDARDSTHWHNLAPDYVADYSLNDEHIPALVALATQWIDEPAESASVYGPVHAWRALGQLRAVAAVEPLLNVQEELDGLGDDWYLEEFPRVFGLIGPPAIEQLTAYLSDDSHGEFPRVNAATGLREIARNYPDQRDPVIVILSEELAKHQRGVAVLNGFFVSYLLQLEAVECAETIERAFAANVIDPTIAGDWCDVQRELGVPGLGIASDQSPGWISVGERPAPAVDDSASEQRKPAIDRKKQKAAKRQVKAKRKQQRKDRKRNRKPR